MTSTLPSESPSVGAEPELDGSLVRPWSPRTSGIVTIVMFVLLAATIVAVFSPIPREAKGATTLVLLLILIFLRVPVGVALGLGGVAGILALAGPGAVANAAGNIAFTQVAVWSLSVIPMFIFMGLLLWRSGLTGLLYDAAKVWLGWMPGGLAVTTNVAGAGLGSVSGSTIGITFALARLAIPEMLRAGYDRRLATGSVLVSGLAGQLIPPSVLLVVYAGIAGTPVGQQLLSGLVPGLLLAGTFVATIILVAGVFRRQWAPRPERVPIPIRTRLLVTAKALPVLVIAVFIVGSIQTGLATPTESAAFGALGAVILTFVYNRRDAIRVLGATLLETAVSCAGLFFLIAGAGFVTRMLSTSGLSRQLQMTIDGLGIDNIALLLLIMLLFLVMGMFLDTTPILLLVVPILIPILDVRGIDLIWFGVFTVILCELGIVTPPVGMLSFIVHKITRQPEVNVGRRISLGDVFAGGMLFIPIVLVLVVVLILFPDIVAWLPSISSAR